MFSSAKFLSPTVTGGLPAPGLAELDAALPPLVELELDVVLLLPQAATASISATASSAAREPRMRGLGVVGVLNGMRRLLFFRLSIYIMEKSRPARPARDRRPAVRGCAP